MASEPKPVASSINSIMFWDFSEISDELESLRLEYAPTTKRNERFPLAWVLRAPTLTGLQDERDGKLPIRRAFEACGVTTGTEIARLAGYGDDSSTVCRWQLNTLQSKTIQEHLFPALCDAYVRAWEQTPDLYSACFGWGDWLTTRKRIIDSDGDSISLAGGGIRAGRILIQVLADVGYDKSPCEELREALARQLDVTRRGIEMEAIFTLFCGRRDSEPTMRRRHEEAALGDYLRAVTAYATTLLDGDELRDLAHHASALVAQHNAAFGTDVMCAAYDPICDSTIRDGLDFTADRVPFSPGDNVWALCHDPVPSEHLSAEAAKINRATLTLAKSDDLHRVGNACRTELERRTALDPLEDYDPFRQSKEGHAGPGGQRG